MHSWHPCDAKSAVDIFTTGTFMFVRLWWQGEHSGGENVDKDARRGWGCRGERGVSKFSSQLPEEHFAPGTKIKESVASSHPYHIHCHCKRCLIMLTLTSFEMHLQNKPLTAWAWGWGSLSLLITFQTVRISPKSYDASHIIYFFLNMFKKKLQLTSCLSWVSHVNSTSKHILYFSLSCSWP